MQNTFTVHCIAWQAAAQLLQDVRAAASQMGILDTAATLTDEIDEHCHHVIALDKSGNAIGCARLKLQGTIDRIVILVDEHHSQIEATMKEALDDYQDQYCSVKKLSDGTKRTSHAVRMAGYHQSESAFEYLLFTLENSKTAMK